VGADDPTGFCTDRTRCQDIIIFLDGENLPADQSCHSDPIEKSEDDEQGNHVGAQLRQDRPIRENQHFLEHDRQQDDHQHVRKRVYDIDYSHHDQVDRTSEVAGNAAVNHADDEYDQACEEADDQGYSGSVNDADEIIAALFIRPEDMRETVIAFVDIFLLHFAVSERCQVLGTLVALSVDGKNLRVSVRDHQRSHDDQDDDEYQHDHAGHGKRVLPELFHAVLEERAALAHDVLLLFFFISRRLELA